jgi:methyl-accepting chemotaxis protein
MIEDPSPAAPQRGRFEFSLRLRVLLVAGLMNIATVALVCWLSAARLEKVYLHQLSIRGETLARSAASSLEPAMLGGDSLNAMAILNDLKSVPELAYAVALDQSGQPVAHTFAGSLPEGFARLHPLEPGQSGPQSVAVRVAGSDVLDTSAPLLQGAVGVLHIGMDLSAARSQVHSLLWHSLFLTLGALSLGILALWLVLGLLVSPVNRLAEATRLIVEKGDLSQDLSFQGSDEVGRLGRHFQELLLKLREIPRQLEGSAQMLAAVVEQMELSASEQGQAVLLQSTSLQETQITAEELRQTSRSAASRARDILGSAEEVDRISERGEEAVARSIRGMQEIRLQGEQTAAKISGLHGRMAEVGAITRTVKDLADQSNVLALNAAIEAVRSGEHGKGFALVAREIRRLADQSIKATDQVRDILNGVSDAMSETMQSSAHGAQRMEGEMQEVRKSGESLRALTFMVQQNAGSVRQIALAVTQQDEGIGQIFTAVNQQASMMDRTRSQLEDARQSLSQLKGLSQSLAALVEQYRA